MLFLYIMASVFSTFAPTRRVHSVYFGHFGQKSFRLPKPSKVNVASNL